jgi:hypothetical protein
MRPPPAAVSSSRPQLVLPARGGHQAKCHRHARLERELLHLLEAGAPNLRVGRARFARLRELKDTDPGILHRMHEPPNLVPRGDPGCDRAIVGRLVSGIERGGEPDGTGVERFTDRMLHDANLVLGRLALERRVPHHVRAQRGVTDVRGVVDAHRQGVERIEVLGECFPLPMDALRHRLTRDVLCAFQIADDEMALLRAGRRQSEAAVTHDHGCHAVEARAGPERVPVHLRVHVGVDVDEARGDDAARGVDLP